MRTLSLFLCVLFGGVTGACSGQETVLKMPRDRDMFFRNYYHTGSGYIQFRPNGAYRRIAREHMFVKEDDHGTWTQADTGEITLVSQDHYRNIECGPFEIYMWHKEAIDRLPPLKASISKMLERNSSRSFASAEIEAIEKYGYENCLSRVSVKDEVKVVPREQLSSLLGRIDEFLNDPEKNRFHLTPMTYKGVTFLLWKDSETPINRDPTEIKRQIDDAKDGERAAYIYLAIDRETFEKESGKTQEFIFHPEMNKCVPQQQEKK